MCVSPLHILNKTRIYSEGFSTPFLDVPCGHCSDCEQRKKDDWMVRAIVEYKRCKKQCGFVWFPTLTYSNENLPIWFDKDFSCPCFQKEHFVSFRNKLRVYLSREGIDLTGDYTMRYFYCCEYGGEKGRPHLHALLFVPKYVPMALFKKLVRKSWIYGQVRYSPSGDSVNDARGIRYAMKYLSKDMHWFKIYGIDEYLDKLKAKAMEDNSLLKKDYAKYHAFLRVLPHHCQSLGFGSDIELTDYDFIEDKIKSCELGLYDTIYSYKIPSYYKRKFLYDYDKVNQLYRLNERGRNVALKRFPKLVDSLDMFLQTVIYSDDIESKIDFLKLDRNILPNYQSYLCLKSFDTHDIALFSLVYRYRSLSENLISEYNDLNEDSFIKLMSDNAYFYYCKQLDDKINLNPLPINYVNSKNRIEYKGYNDTNCYRTFHNGLSFIEMINKEFSIFLKKRYESDLEKSQSQKFKVYV